MMNFRLLPLLASVCVIGSASAQSGEDRVLWRFEMDSAAAGGEVAVGPDGTVYASDDSTLYAVGPDGVLKWARAGVGGGKPVDFLSGGTVIAGEGTTIHAIDPADGSDIWTFTFDGNGSREHIEVGPNVGPDGNIYAASSTDGSFGLGAYSLTPTGQLRWNDRGQPMLDLINATTNQPVRFTADRLIFPFNVVAESPPHVYGYDFDGHQTLYVDFTCTGIPRTDSLDRILIASACGIEAIEQDGDEVYWRVNLGSIHLAPVMGADATAYAGAWLGALSAIRPDGSIAWTSGAVNDPVNMLSARQDVGQLVCVEAGFGTPQTVVGVDASGGARLWEVPLRSVGGHNEIVESQTAPTNGSGSAVYFTTRFTSLGAPGALWAVMLGEGCDADFNRDGNVNTLDVLAFLNAWSSGDESGDFNGDGTINTLDVLAFLNAWSDGC